jgi:hypothetical protein
MQVRAPAVRRALALACATITVGVVGGCGDDDDRGSCGNGVFDQAAWRAPGSEGRNGLLGAASKRQDLADRMIACRTLDGRARPDVRRLLGKPDFPSRATRYYYELGEGRSAGPLDNEFLSISFNRGGHVKGVEIVGF